MKAPVSQCRAARSRGGFSLVEVTLAVGIMAFSLVGILGVLPLAMNSGRQSFNQARASAVANTLFTSIRSQPFGEVRYLDDQFDAAGSPISGSATPLNLNVLGTVSSSPTPGASTGPSGKVQFYAKFLDVPTDAGIASDNLGNQRRLCFTSTQPKEGADFLVTMYFDNKPDGTIVPSDTPGRIGQANRITLVVSTATRDINDPLRDPFRFVTTIANRLN